MRNHSSRACFRSALPGKSGPWLVSWFLLSALFLSHLLGASASEDSKVDFQRQIRPLLSNACFQYHGPDAKTRVAGLRLDLREALFQSQASGVPIAPGEPERSLIYQRITHPDVTRRMPPEYSHKELSGKQIDLVRRWIKQGAVWQQHWSFVPLQRPTLPRVNDSSWAKHGMDYFVLQRLERESLGPSAAAERSRILRRVTLDLTGLPPTLEELDAFLADRSADAYQKVVDRLLASPRYGERMAVVWLDLARYADTDGYQDDEPRIMWRWRDWLIDALNNNMPFDQFTIEQLAGDLIPKARPDQQLATGFLRNNRVNGKGGSIADEFQVEYIADRINTVATTWLGLTVACARCHDHKYDPIFQKEFYRLYAFFNNVSEPGTYRRSASPTIKVPRRGVQRRLDQIDQALKDLNEKSATFVAFEKKKQRLIEQVPETMIMELPSEGV